MNYGAFAVEVGAGAKPGDAVRVIVDPPIPFLRRSNRARTGRARGRRSIRVERASANGFEDVVVSGVVPAGSAAKTYYRSVRHPARYAGAVIRAQLEANGIEIAGETIVGPVPQNATPILSFRSKSLAEIVRLFLKFSNNAIAESLVKAMGARATGGPGTWESGIAAVRAELSSLGLDVEPLTLVDGSGLSYGNRVPPRSLVEALRIGCRRASRRRRAGILRDGERVPGKRRRGHGSPRPIRVRDGRRSVTPRRASPAEYPSPRRGVASPCGQVGFARR